MTYTSGIVYKSLVDTMRFPVPLLRLLTLIRLSRSKAFL